MAKLLLATLLLTLTPAVAHAAKGDPGPPRDCAVGATMDKTYPCAGRPAPAPSKS